MGKVAFITGISGQDGAYLARFLLHKGVRVVGSSRRAGQQIGRLVELDIAREVEVVALDWSDLGQMTGMLAAVRPDEIYHLAAQSSVGGSFEHPVETAEIVAMGAARLLEAFRRAAPGARFFQASSSEIFGEPQLERQDEATPLRPRNPYAIAKAFARGQTVCYRHSLGLFAACGILFNHESPLRGREFVTRKITSGLAEIKHGRREVVQLGNIDVRRGWGFAGDFVEAMWRMLQAAKPDDYVIASAETASVRDFATRAAERLGFALEWSGAGASEVAVDRHTGRTIIRVTADLYRPSDVAASLGNAAKAARELGWTATTTLDDLVDLMVEADERRIRDGSSLV